MRYSNVNVADIRGASDANGFAKRQANRIIRHAAKRAFITGEDMEDCPRRVRDVTKGWLS